MTGVRPFALLVIGVAVAVGVAAGVVIWELWRQVSVVRETIGGLGERHAGLEQQVLIVGSKTPTDEDWRRLTAQVEHLEAAQDRFADRTEIDTLSATLSRQLRAVEDRLGVLALQPEAGAETVTIARQMAEISRMAKTNLERNELLIDIVAIQFTLRNVVDAVWQGKPFETELSQLNNVVGWDKEAGAAIRDLIPFAETGITVPTVLAEQFEDVERAVRTTLQEQSNRTWTGLFDRLAGLVQIRRTRPPTGEELEAVLTRAALLAEKQDLREAWEESGKISEELSDELVGWRWKAEATLTVLDTTRLLEYQARRVMQELHAEVNAKRRPGAK